MKTNMFCEEYALEVFYKIDCDKLHSGDHVFQKQFQHHSTSVLILFRKDCPYLYT